MYPILDLIFYLPLLLQMRYSHILLHLIFFESVYYSIHRLYHLGFTFLMPWHHIHHKNPQTIIGILTSDFILIIIYFCLLKLIIPINNYFLFYFLITRTMSHYFSHHKHLFRCSTIFFYY